MTIGTLGRRFRGGRQLTAAARLLLGALAWAFCASAASAQTTPKFEGVVAHKADVAGKDYKKGDGSSVDGAGVKVCVISINAMYLNDAKSNQTLPSATKVLPGFE